MELSREQHEDNYNLAVEQNNQAEAERIRMQMEAEEYAAADAKAAEIAAIWRGQQKVADEWAEAVN